MITYKEKVPDEVHERAKEAREEMMIYSANLSNGDVKFKHVMDYLLLNIAELQIELEKMKCQD